MYILFMGIYYIVVFLAITLVLKISYNLSKDEKFLTEFNETLKENNFENEYTPQAVNNLARMIAISICVVGIAAERVVYFILL